MMYFITGNKGKFEEVRAILPEVEQLDIDLPEIQEIDAREVIKAKLRAALAHTFVDGEGERGRERTKEFIVEDISLYLDCLGGLPGPLIKWFMRTIGNEGVAELASKYGNDKVTAKTMIGYARSKDDLHFFEGVIEGRIVSPRGESGFGWDPIFLPDGHEKTFAEMTADEKNTISMRRIATNKLKDFLSQ